MPAKNSAEGPVLSPVEGSGPRKALAPASLPARPRQATPASEATSRIGADDRSPIGLLAELERRGRSGPPTLKEVIAALSKYRNRALTHEQHRAVLELMVGWGHFPPECLDRSARDEGPGDPSRPAVPHFASQSDALRFAKRHFRRTR